MLKHLSGHKFKIKHTDTRKIHEEHGDHLKLFPDVEVVIAVDRDDVAHSETQPLPERRHGCNLRPGSDAVGARVI